MTPDADLAAFAAEQGVGVAALRATLDALHAQAGADHFYIFWTAGGGGASKAGRQRVLLAFRTPDSALSFAQRNQLAAGPARPRLRRLTLLQLVQALLREPAIVALLFAEEDEDGPAPAGRLPRGARIERADLLRRLAEQAL